MIERRWGQWVVFPEDRSTIVGFADRESAEIYQASLDGFVDHDPDQCTHTGGGES